MRAQPLSSEVRGGVLCITLDTPACPVNIFSHQAAVLLLASLDEIDDGVRAVVLQSGKPGSFVNGVGLMLASAVARPDDVPRLTATIRQAYQALGDLKIPTVAAIRGNCYGCGVELIAKCRYRVAADGYDTHFYMTELADYLFVPTFGGTQVLPRLLGLESATDFVLWGQRWSASDALARGLLHGVYPDDTFDEARGTDCDGSRPTWRVRLAAAASDRTSDRRNGHRPTYAGTHPQVAFGIPRRLLLLLRAHGAGLAQGDIRQRGLQRRDARGGPLGHGSNLEGGALLFLRSPTM
jgi:enoyl-CoA hydratase/carnithine racemase